MYTRTSTSPTIAKLRGRVYTSCFKEGILPEFEYILPSTALLLLKNSSTLNTERRRGADNGAVGKLSQNNQIDNEAVHCINYCLACTFRMY
jgi:hypothetical protein